MLSEGLRRDGALPLQNALCRIWYRRQTESDARLPIS
jgi:hypothetical protein